MQTQDLFCTRFFKTKIDKKSYDKEKIIEECIFRYKEQPYRNDWDNFSVLHHYTNDMVNGPDLSSLDDIYDNIIQDYMSSIQGDFDYRWHLTNIAINTKYMTEHDHFHRLGDSQCMFACIHYISYNKDFHSSTRFKNPLKVSDPFDNYKHISKQLYNTLDNSTYFSDYILDTEEDDFVIFPSYLKHCVDNGTKDDSIPRIVSSINIEWKT